MNCSIQNEQFEMMCKTKIFGNRNLLPFQKDLKCVGIRDDLFQCLMLSFIYSDSQHDFVYEMIFKNRENIRMSIVLSCLSKNKHL